MSARTTAVVFILAMLGGAANGEPLNVDFNGHQGNEGGATYAAPGPLGGGVWNGLDVELDTGHAPIEFSGLLDGGGNASPITIELTGWYEADFYSAGPYDNDLYSDYLVSADDVGDASILLAGLLPNHLYDLVVFTTNDGNDFGAVVSINGGPARTAVGGAASPMFEDTIDMLAFTQDNGLVVSADGDGQIELIVTGERPFNNTLQSVVNGLQIELVPEPVTAAVLLFSGLALLQHRPRRPAGDL